MMTKNIQKNKYFYVLALLLPTILIFLILLKDGIPFCCDAHYYLNTMEGYRKNGIFFEHSYLGYRSYFFPYLYSYFPFNLSTKIQIGTNYYALYSLVSISLFIIAEAFIIFNLLKTHALKLFYISLFLNPFVLIYVAYPLQESFMMLIFIIFIPLIYIAFKKSNETLLMVLLGLFFSSMYMTRGSLVLLIVPTLVFTVYILYKSKNKVKSLVLFIAMVALPIIPQSIISMKLLDTINPYSATTVLDLQFKYGNTNAKYATNLSGNKKISVAQPYWNPLACSTEASISTMESRVFECRADNQPLVTNLSSLIQNNSFSQLVFKSVLHLFNALNYDYLKPYITVPTPPIFSWHQLLSMLIVFLGFYQIIKSYILKQISMFDIFLDLILVVTLGVCLFFQIETRFGLLATVVLSIKSIQLLLYNRPKGTEALALIFSGGLFLLLTSLLSVYILLLSGALN